MADISEFNINNTLYNLKDTQARNIIESLSTKYISLSTGGTVENSIYASNRAGLLTILDADIDNPPIEEVISGGVGNKTIDSKMSSLLRSRYTPEGDLIANFEVVKNISINNEETRKNSVNLIITSTGVNKVELDKDAWQEALQVLPLSGGTLTGELKLDKQHLTLITGLSLTTSYTSTYYSNNISFKDNTGNQTIGALQITKNSSNTVSLRFVSSNGDVNNNFNIGVKNDGTRIVNFTESKVWRIGLGSDSDGIWPISLGGTGATSITSSSGAVHNLFPTNLGTTIQYLNGMTQNWVSTGYVKLPLPIELGGTGTTTATANRVFAAPNNSNGEPSFRALVAADIPNLNASKITAGTLPVERGGTGNTGWVTKNGTISSGASSGTIYGRSWGKVVNIFSHNIKLASALSTTGSLEIGKVDSSLYPAINRWTVAGNGSNYECLVRIGSDGVINFYGNRNVQIPSGQTLGFQCVYLIE